MSTDSAFNGYGYLSPYADTCFYRDEKNGLFENCQNSVSYTHLTLPTILRV